MHEPGRGEASQLLDEAREREVQGWSGSMGQMSSGEWAQEELGSTVLRLGKGKSSGDEQPFVWNILPLSTTAARADSHAPYSLPDITNCLVTFPIL